MTDESERFAKRSSAIEQRILTTSPIAGKSAHFGDAFFTAFERLCERTTMFVSGHWGTLTAVVLLVVGSIVFLREQDATFASRLEQLMTMLSLILLVLLQRSQTKATLSLQVKLNEILKAMHETDNRMINIEHLSEEDLKELHDSYERLHGRDPDGGRQRASERPYAGGIATPAP
jgi:low affinity Fe/Cu permease